MNKNYIKEKADIGLIGVGLMGENLIMNMSNHNFTVACYDIDRQKTDEFLNTRAKNRKIFGAYSLKELIENLKTPRKIMIMIRAGKPVDMVVDELKNILDKGDIIIDGGNSNFQDTIRRVKDLEEMGLLYVGMGVSGGEEGALNGPSLMPGGSYAAWEHIKPIFQTICAHVNEGDACCDYVGENGAGHFVKMVHNGIEYGDMELICETYSILKNVLHLTNEQMSDVFNKWNEDELNSYLIEITANILKVKDKDGTDLIDNILDTAGQKGTGKWTAITALDEGVPLTLINEAVYARCLSAMKEERVVASKEFDFKKNDEIINKDKLIEDLKKALYAAKIISYAQGYSLMRTAAKTYNWNLNYGGIALMWRGGCIIRSRFLGKIKEAYDNNSNLTNLLLDPYFKQTMLNNIDSLRKVVIKAMEYGISVPSLASALTYFDGYRSERLPANLLQAQRDYFGGHTYERLDKNRGEFFHTNWTGHGGNKSSTTYND